MHPLVAGWLAHFRPGPIIVHHLSWDIRLIVKPSGLNDVILSATVSQTTGPGPTAVRGQQQGLNTPPSGRERCYSSLPSKHQGGPYRARDPLEGFRVPPIPATPGRTQPTPSASRSIGAELTGVAISILGIWCSHSLTGLYPSGHMSVIVNHFGPKPKRLARSSPGCPRQQEGGPAGWDPLEQQPQDTTCI